jgi:hypothetical protein
MFRVRQATCNTWQQVGKDQQSILGGMKSNDCVRMENMPFERKKYPLGIKRSRGDKQSMAQIQSRAKNIV